MSRDRRVVAGIEMFPDRAEVGAAPRLLPRRGDGAVDQRRLDIVDAEPRRRHMRPTTPASIAKHSSR